MQQAVSFSKVPLTLFFMLFTGALFAQKDTTDTGEIDTQRLIIVKPYSPTVSDAFKLKQTPKKSDSTEREKKDVSYDIFSIPVASTFTPEKGRAAGVKRQRQPDLYDNYAALGFGNYTNIFAEFYSTIAVGKRQDLSIALEHNSSQGGIDGVELDDKYYDTKFDVGLTSDEDTFTWNGNLGFQHQLYNWYGIPEDSFTSEEYNSIDPQHTYIGVTAGGEINMKQGVFDKASLNYRHFGDDFSSSEDHVVFKPNFQFPVGREKINAEISADYLSGKFDDAPAGQLNYGFLNLGLHPSISITRDKLALDLGAQVVYSSNIEQEESDVFVYPKIKGSYRVAGDYFTLYAGAEGELQQNTYHGFVQENRFLSPDLLIAPTNKQYDIYAGGKGKFTKELRYDLRGSYISEEAKALFIHNGMSGFSPNEEPYLNGNSFRMTYDDITTISVYGELSYSMNENLNFGISATYYNYSTDIQEEAWNLPDMEASLNADYQITEKWSAGAGLFFVGERKDLFDGLLNTTRKIVKLDSYIDANLRVGFQATDQLGFFLRGNNLFGDNYEKWYGYPVQGIQGMFGASYQF